jgi:3-dehydroquinate dehydratase-2
VHRVLVLSGPSLHLLGSREPAIYGTTTLEEIHAGLAKLAEARGASVECRQSNHEGSLVDAISTAPGAFDAILLNAGAYTHTSIALRDVLKAVALPCVEVHLSNPEAREPFRRRSMIAAACVGKVSGFGARSYAVALGAVLDLLDDPLDARAESR